MISDYDVLMRLLLVAVLTGLIGFERERHGRAAGLRTHILVGIGACLMMLTGVYMTSLGGPVAVDPTRIGAQVVSGIGFLGAGTILHFRASIRGLTTAASLWAVAGIGLAVGAGFISGAMAATGIVYVTLFGLASVEHRMRKDWYRQLVLESGGSSGELAAIRKVLSDHSAEIRDFEIKQHGTAAVIELDVKLLSQYDEDAILKDIQQVEGVHRAYWA